MKRKENWASGKPAPSNTKPIVKPIEAASRTKSDRLNYSKPFDIHLWSDHPDVDRLTDEIYQQCSQSRKANDRKRHIKCLLLNFFVTWVEDPERVIAIHQGRNSYSKNAPNNELGISNTLISISDDFVKAELLEKEDGFYDRSTQIGRVARFWATDKLKAFFEAAVFCILDIYPSNERKVLILREKDEGDEESEERIVDLSFIETEQTASMAQNLRSYNDLLRRTFIDIPDNETGLLPYDKSNERRSVVISQRDKFVRRIFNRGSFEFGGRFYGGWWQRCPKEYRPKIYINDQPTIEVDFSGLHIVMLYANEGIKYWEDIGNDPYYLAPIDFCKSPVTLRKVAKNLLLTLLNAGTVKDAYSAFRMNQSKGSPQKRYTDKQLSVIHEMLNKKHPRIADYFCADAGIRLMNQDARISEFIIQQFTEWNMPILCLHDSYIIQDQIYLEEGETSSSQLLETMKRAFETVMSVPLTTQPTDTSDWNKFNKEPLEDLITHYGSVSMPYEALETIQMKIDKQIRSRSKPNKSQRYKDNWDQFQTYFS